MTKYVAKRIQFRNGERLSVLHRPGQLPVHEATLFLARFRTRSRTPNTINAVCTCLALLYRWLHSAEIDLLGRLQQGSFLTAVDVSRLVETAQQHLDDIEDEPPAENAKAQVVDLHTVRMRRSKAVPEQRAVDSGTHATRLRYIHQYLTFLVGYIAATLPRPLKAELEEASKQVLDALHAQVPSVPAKRGTRQGMSEEEQTRLLEVVHFNSSSNPWRREFVRERNWVIVVLLLATGMRRGELLNLRLSDLKADKPFIDIVRRPHDATDPRLLQPTPKTRERTLELRPAIMKTVWKYIQKRSALPGARKHPYLIVNDEGDPLAYKSVDGIFADIRTAAPDIKIDLSSHVMRHTWNDRFSEQAEAMELSEVAEQRARNEQQGWTDDSKSAATYTRRYATRKGRELALKLQEKLDVPDQ